MSLKNTVLPVQSTIQSKGRLLNLSTPVVMGILNATPDSFFNQGKDSDVSGLLHNAERMLSEGAAILDVGGLLPDPEQNSSAPMKSCNASYLLSRPSPKSFRMHG